MPPRQRSGGEVISVQIHVDAEKVSDEFKQAQREMRGRLKEGLQRAGEKVALPEARRRAGGLKVGGTSIATTLVVRPRSRDAVLTTTMRGKKARAVGLLEFGGTVSSRIEPKRKRALTVGDGIVAHVESPRTYKPKLFMTSAVEAKQREIRVAVTEEVMKAFEGLDVE